MSSNLKVNSLVPATGTEIGIGTTGGSIDFRCPATFGGNVTIGGTLTYDEVINIDSIGIVTARSGLKVTGGQLDVGSNIKAGNAGVITATTFSGSGASLTGLTAGQIPNLAASKITSGTVATARLGSGTANNTTYLRGDQTWATVSSGPGTGQQYVNLESLGSASNTGNNTFAGYLAGNSLNSADHSTFFGYQAGKAALNAGNNTFFGSNSGLLATGSDNSGFGQGTLETITSASENVAVGRRALNTTTTSQNVAIGAQALRYQSTGQKNTAVGYQAGIKITTSNYNTAFGYKTLTGDGESHNVTGGSNVVMGYMSGYGISSGEKNVLIGYESGYDMTTGYWNSGLGHQSLENVGVGTCNTAIGYRAGHTISNGNNNICIGNQVTATASDTSNEITLGNSDITKLRIPGLNYYNVGGSIGVNEATPDFSGFGGNGGGIELDDVNTGFTAVKLSQSGTDLYLVAHSGAAYISTRTNKEIVVEKNSTEVAKFTDNGLKFPNGKGIDFSANTDAGGTSSATLLEDYESGSYTSSIVSSNCTLDNSSGTGYYIKVGNMVYVRGLFSMNTQSGSPSKSGTDNIVQALPYAIKSGGTSMTGTMIVENINSGAPTSSVGHPLWYNTLPSGFVCLAGSNGIRFYINKIEAAYVRMNNSHLNVGYPGYTWMSWNIVYETN